MKNIRYNKGFTLIEVMLAAAILVIGLMLVAAAFPVGIKLTAIATERTIGAVVSAEASAKIKLFGDPNDYNVQAIFGIDFQNLPTTQLADFDTTLKQVIDPTEHDYPSANTGDTKYYNWSALIKRDGTVGQRITAVVFANRTTGPGAKYPNPLIPNPLNPAMTIPVPKPIPVPVVFPDTGDDNIIAIANYPSTPFDETKLADHISDGATLVMLDDVTGEVMILNVLERDGVNIKLTEKIYSDTVSNRFWVIPTAVGSSRNPCIGVYTETISF